MKTANEVAEELFQSEQNLYPRKVTEHAKSISSDESFVKAVVKAYSDQKVKRNEFTSSANRNFPERKGY